MASTANGSSSKNKEPVLHPLEYEWTLWWYNGDGKTKTWIDNMHDVFTFGTIEDFWRLHNTVRKVLDLQNGHDYAIFKKGIKPMWEDNANKNGGRWMVNVDSSLKPQLNEIWLRMVLFMTGESFDECGNDVCGLFINNRSKVNRIGLWISTTNESTVMEIGRLLKICLKPWNQRITFEAHADCKRNSKNNTLYAL